MNCDGGWRQVGRARVWSVVLLGSLAGTPAALHAAIPQTGCYKREGLEPKVEAVIDEFRASVPGTMNKGGVPNGGSLRDLWTYRNRVSASARTDGRIRCAAEKCRGNHVFGDFVNSSAKPLIIRSYKA